jgi:hypothetical protein
MKHAYISFVFIADGTACNSDIERLDQLLHSVAARHEILMVKAKRQNCIDESKLELYGPISVISVSARATEDERVLSGLGRAVGDFVFCWQSSLDLITAGLLSACLGKTDDGCEVIEIVSNSQPSLIKLAYFVTNVLRKNDRRIQRSNCVVYSRFAIEKLLEHATYDPQLRIIRAELPVSRTTVQIDKRMSTSVSLGRRIFDMASLIGKGSNLGTAIPIMFSALSAFLGIGVMFYSLVVLLIKDSTPQGWTTLMIITGLNFAVVMSSLTLIWSRLESISKSVATRIDLTSSVNVISPSKQ